MIVEEQSHRDPALANGRLNAESGTGGLKEHRDGRTTTTQLGHMTWNRSITGFPSEVKTRDPPPKLLVTSCNSLTTLGQ